MRIQKNMAWIITFLMFLLISPASGQSAFPGPSSTGAFDNFKLTIEPAWVAPEQPNTVGKNEFEKKLFPNSNSIVEFFYNDSSCCYYGFRIDTVSTNNYIMEVAWVTDLKEKHTVERKKIPISVDLGAGLWEAYYVIMKFYTNSIRTNVPDSSDRYSATVRWVVEDYLLWSFSVESPFSHIKDLTTTCNEIVKDVSENGQMINEKKHINNINSIHTKVLFNRKDPKSQKIPGFKLELDSMQLIKFDK